MIYLFCYFQVYAGFVVVAVFIFRLLSFENHGCLNFSGLKFSSDFNEISVLLKLVIFRFFILNE